MVKRWQRLIAAVTVTVLASIAMARPATTAPGDAPAAVRRLTKDQYTQVIGDLFGNEITISGRFEPDLRREGLLAVGASALTVTPSGAEQYDVMARGIAAQIVDVRHRDSLLACRPKDPVKADPACARKVLGDLGRLLHRRPLAADYLEQLEKEASSVATQRQDFYYGLQSSLAGMLIAPEFLFVVERGAPDATRSDAILLDGYSKAQRISFMLWNSTPDNILLDAAARGELDTRAGLVKQVSRMTQSPRFERGVRAFFSDWFAFNAFDDLAKDPMIYPKFTSTVAADAREQTLRKIVDHLVGRNGGYRELFTTRHTVMNRRLGALYRVPVTARVGWEPHEFAADDPRAGLLGELSFLQLYSHPGRSSPTLRGKAVREILLCQEVPAPPANVNFSVVQDTNNPNLRTARDRLREHGDNPVCAGCHKLVDPIGLALEHFDSSGEYRAVENGATIDVNSVYNGRPIAGAVGLGQALAQEPAASRCLVERLYGYGVGRPLNDADRKALTPLEEDFATADSYRELLKSIVTSEEFYRVPRLPESASLASVTP